MTFEEMLDSDVEAFFDMDAQASEAFIEDSPVRILEENTDFFFQGELGGAETCNIYFPNKDYDPQLISRNYTKIKIQDAWFRIQQVKQITNKICKAVIYKDAYANKS